MSEGWFELIYGFKFRDIDFAIKPDILENIFDFLTILVGFSDFTEFDPAQLENPLRLTIKTLDQLKLILKLTQLVRGYHQIISFARSPDFPQVQNRTQLNIFNGAQQNVTVLL